MRGFPGLFLLAFCLAACSGDDDDDTGAGDGDADADADADADGDADGDVPACGDRVVGDAEECDGIVGCDEGSACNADCACEARPAPPPTSQDLIERDFADGTIDYPTSLMYRVWALFHAPELPEAYDGEGSRGEDQSLFLELSHVRGTLPVEIEDAIAPYLARPDDPSSIWSQPFVEMGGGDETPHTVPCPPNAQGAADWVPLESAHFVVWSCGGGVAGSDDLAGRRAAASDVFEDAYEKMVGPFSAPRGDDFPNGPADRSRIDVYLLRPNECRIRQGRCVPISHPAIAAAVPATPCVREGGGALSSSGYLIMGANDLEDGEANPDVSSHFRYLAAHELFHVLAFRMNFEAQGGFCPAGAQPSLRPYELRSWLSEASAEWASFRFFANDAPGRRTQFFSEFQRGRDDRTIGLQATEDEYPYKAFIYPTFTQEETGQMTESQVMQDLWVGGGAARTREAFDDRLDTLFPFADHFRDFTVRNFNRDLPGEPIAIPHASKDAALTFGGEDHESWVVQPPWTLPAPFEFRAPLSIAPLAMQTEHVILRNEVRSLRVDGTALGNAGHLSLDVIVKVNGEWSRRRLGAPVFEICRDDDVDDVSEAYLIWSNFDHDRAGRVEGDATITTRTACPGGWSGTIRYIMSSEEHYVDAQPAGTEVFDASKSDVQTWSVVGTRMVLPPGAPEGFEVETIDTAWHGAYTHALTSSFTSEQCGTSTTTEGGAGSADGNPIFTVVPLGPGRFALQATTVAIIYEVPIQVDHEPCDAPASSGVERNEQVNEGITIILGIPELGTLQESPNGSGHFQGRGTFFHDEQARPGGGSSVFDISAEWDLTRRRLE